MVAASILFNFGLAHRAERYVVFVGLCPLAKLLVHGIFARDVVTMPDVSALEAHLCATLMTC